MVHLDLWMERFNPLWRNNTRRHGYLWWFNCIKSIHRFIISEYIQISDRRSALFILVPLWLRSMFFSSSVWMIKWIRHLINEWIGFPIYIHRRCCHDFFSRGQLDTLTHIATVRTVERSVFPDSWICSSLWSHVKYYLHIPKWWNGKEENRCAVKNYTRHERKVTWRNNASFIGMIG